MHLLLAGNSYHSYLKEMTIALRSLLPRSTVNMTSELTDAGLDSACGANGGITHLVLCAEHIGNLEQLLHTARTRNPGLVIVTIGALAPGLPRSDALTIMQNLRIEMHVDMVVVEGRLSATVLAAQGDALLENITHGSDVALCLATYFLRMGALLFPLRKTPFVTGERDSFRDRDLHFETEIPIGGHPGAFGVTRRHHTHEGVDLYGLPGDVVSSMEDGLIIAIRPFTGTAIGSPHWADTQCVLVEGRSGVLNYGEIVVEKSLAVGDAIIRGQTLGALATVLLESKGRPDTMLHLERYFRSTKLPILEWPLGVAQPDTLLDPTALLVQAAQSPPRPRVCIIGRRGLVSQRLQAALTLVPQIALTVVATATVLQEDSHPDVMAADLVVVCTLEESSANVVNRLPTNVRVLDLSPAFRGDPGWVYGLPELPGVEAAIRTATRVSNPGCFATAAVLLLEPLVRSGAIRPETPLYLDGAGGLPRVARPWWSVTAPVICLRSAYSALPANIGMSPRLRSTRT